MNKILKIYQQSDIETVYIKHRKCPGSVLYSEDGYTWETVPADFTKWHTNWVFTFIELTKSGYLYLLNEEVNHG
jgi:hypothetical protein